MTTFYVESKVDLIILVDDFENVRIIKKCFSYMFDFQHGSIHLFRDAAYNHNSVVKNSIYQESISNPNGVHWDVKAGSHNELCKGQGQGGGMKSQNKGPRMRLKLNGALHFENVLFPRPIIKQEAKFLMNIGNHQA